MSLFIGHSSFHTHTIIIIICGYVSVFICRYVPTISSQLKSPVPSMDCLASGGPMGSNSKQYGLYYPSYLHAKAS